jgi:hypothetical protein
MNFLADVEILYPYHLGLLSLPDGQGSWDRNSYASSAEMKHILQDLCTILLNYGWSCEVAESGTVV